MLHIKKKARRRSPAAAAVAEGAHQGLAGRAPQSVAVLPMAATGPAAAKRARRAAALVKRQEGYSNDDAPELTKPPPDLHERMPGPLSADRIRLEKEYAERVARYDSERALCNFPKGAAFYLHKCSYVKGPGTLSYPHFVRDVSGVHASHRCAHCNMNELKFADTLFFTYLYESSAPIMEQLFPTVHHFIEKLKPLESGSLGAILRAHWSQEAPDADLDKDMDSDTRFRFWLLKRGFSYNPRWSYMQHAMSLMQRAKKVQRAAMRQDNQNANKNMSSSWLTSKMKAVSGKWQYFNALEAYLHGAGILGFTFAQDNAQKGSFQSSSSLGRAAAVVPAREGGEGAAAAAAADTAEENAEMRGESTLAMTNQSGSSFDDIMPFVPADVMRGVDPTKKNMQGFDAQGRPLMLTPIYFATAWWVAQLVALEDALLAHNGQAHGPALTLTFENNIVPASRYTWLQNSRRRYTDRVAITGPLHLQGDTKQQRPHSMVYTKLLTLRSVLIVPGDCDSRAKYFQSFAALVNMFVAAGFEKRVTMLGGDSAEFNHVWRYVTYAATKLKKDMGWLRPLLETWHSAQGLGKHIFGIGVTKVSDFLPFFLAEIHAIVGGRAAKKSRLSINFHFCDILLFAIDHCIVYEALLPELAATCGAKWATDDGILTYRYLHEELLPLMAEYVEGLKFEDEKGQLKLNLRMLRAAHVEGASVLKTCMARDIASSVQPEEGAPGDERYAQAGLKFTSPEYHHHILSLATKKCSVFIETLNAVHGVGAIEKGRANLQASEDIAAAMPALLEAIEALKSLLPGYIQHNESFPQTAAMDRKARGAGCEAHRKGIAKNIRLTFNMLIDKKGELKMSEEDPNFAAAREEDYADYADSPAVLFTLSFSGATNLQLVLGGDAKGFYILEKLDVPVGHTTRKATFDVLEVGDRVLGLEDEDDFPAPRLGRNLISACTRACDTLNAELPGAKIRFASRDRRSVRHNGKIYHCVLGSITDRLTPKYRLGTAASVRKFLRATENANEGLITGESHEKVKPAMDSFFADMTKPPNESNKVVFKSMHVRRRTKEYHAQLAKLKEGDDAIARACVAWLELNRDGVLTRLEEFRRKLTDAGAPPPARSDLVYQLASASKLSKVMVEAYLNHIDTGGGAAGGGAAAAVGGHGAAAAGGDGAAEVGGDGAAAAGV